jgi:fucose permease
MTSARRAVGVVFALNGLLFASLISRVPDLRRALDLDNTALGLLLLAIAAGSLIALPSSGRLIDRWSAATVMRGGALLVAVGLCATAAGAEVGSAAGTAVGLFAYGVGTGVWDVAMNVEGADVERRLGRTIMPRFHAGFSLGTMAGAGIGVLVAAGDVPMVGHLAVLSVVGLVATSVAARQFREVDARPEVAAVPSASAWTEPRTLLIGVMVLTFAVAEGTANDWISLALIDGYDAREWVGVAGFAVFVTAMTAGRLLGPPILDRFGRAPVLWACAGAVAVGVALTVWGAHPVPAAVGIVVWGLGASLGFPVGMSAAAADPARAPARLSVVSTIGYGAFLGGPPLVGWVGDRVGTLDSLLVVLALMVPATVAVLATREPSRH